MLPRQSLYICFCCSLSDCLHSNSYSAAQPASHWIQTGPKQSPWVMPLPITVHKDTLPRGGMGPEIQSTLLAPSASTQRGSLFSYPQRLHNAKWSSAHALPSTLNLFPHWLPILVLASPSFQWPGFKTLEWGILDYSIPHFLRTHCRTDIQNTSRPWSLFTASTLPHPRP